MGNLLNQGFASTISLEEHSRYYAMYGIGANYWNNKWLNFPVICCIILDMLISLYLALQMQSVVAYALSNVCFHLLIFPLVWSAWDFTFYNDHTKPRLLCERESMSYYVFVINILFSVPFLVIKAVLLSLYIPYISNDILPWPFTPLSLLIIWSLISLPFIIKFQIIYGLFYWIACSFVLILLCFTFPGFWFQGGSFYVIDCDTFETIMDNLGPERTDVKYQGDNSIQLFLISNTIHDELLYLEEEREHQICYICGCQLLVDLHTIKLVCQHKFHSACLERFFAQQILHKCPNCNKDINIFQRKSRYNILEADKLKSPITKLHYYLLLLSYRPSKLYLINIMNKNLRYLDVFLSTPGVIILPFIAGFTGHQSICVLSNSFIFLIIFQMIAYFTSRESALTTEDLNYIWTDYIMHRFNGSVCEKLLYQLSLLWIIFMLTISSFIIIPIFDTFAIPEFLFLGFLIYQGIHDIFFHCALVHVFCTLITIIYDIFVVFPVTVYQMIAKKKSLNQVWLRY